MKMRMIARLSASTATLLVLAVAAPAVAQQQPDAGADANTAPSATTPTTPSGPANDIVVTGIRQSLSSAQNIKRNSDAIVDALVAEDIGKFPDNNASEAIARITGVQVTRYLDEANGVLIRGLPNVQTTVQGREIFTADGRSV